MLRFRLTAPALFGLLAASAAFATLPDTAQAQDNDENVVVDPSYLSGISYRMVGPYRGGRVTAVTGIPDHPFRFYMGTTGGGVWTTDDAGESWTNITDGQLQVGGIGAITVAPSDPNVIYAGTGSAEPRGNVSPGRGIYRSTDAGKTWSFIGLRDSGQIGRIQVHPDNPDHVYVAATGNIFGNNSERGVFESTDGGETWENVLFISDSTGVVDLAMDPSNPRIMFASAWRAQRTPWTMISGGEEGGVYRTKDAGRTWTKLGAGLPAGMVGKIGVAISPANPNRVWALFEAEEGGLYRSDNGGDRWRRVSAEKGIWHRPWYYMRVTADPTDENTIWINNVLYYKSLDGGATFTIVPTPHPDSHATWINPNNPDIMIEGNDGGANVSLNGGRTWSSQRNQPTAELYRVSVDNQYPYRLYAGQQDNTTISVPSRLRISNVSDFEEEYQVGGGESGHVAVDPSDPNIVYAGSFGGTITRMHVPTGKAREIMTYPQLQLGQLTSDLRYRFQWNAPIRISPHNANVLYHTSQVVHRSMDGGQSWEDVSPDLTTDNPDHQGFPGGPITKDGTGVEVYGTIFSFEESPTSAGVLWAGSDDGLIHVSRDDAGSWTNVTPDGFPEGATVNSIDPGHHDPGTAYVAAFKYREADFRPYIYKTTDYGQSWTSLADGENGIPVDNFVRVVREDPARQGLLYAGTEFGIYVSFDDGEHWQSFQRNLPVTPITDIQVHEHDLVLSTQGRSFWIADNLTPLHQMTDMVRAADVHLYEPRPAIRNLLGGFSLGGGRRAQNPPDGAIMYYSLAGDVEGPITIHVTDERGDTAKTFSSEPQQGPDLGAFAALAELFGLGGGGGLLPTTRGLHRISWDLRYPAPTLPQGTVVFGTAPPPAAPPGEYTVTLTHGETSQSHTLTVLADPRIETTQAEYVAQFEFLRALEADIELMGERMADLRSARTQTQGITGVLENADLSEEDEARVREMADSISTKLTGVEEDMQQTNARSFYDPLEMQGKLTAQLVYLYGVTAGSFGGPADAGPTDGAQLRFDELHEEVNDVVGRLQQVLDEDLAAFNELLKSLDLDPVVVKKDRAVIS